ncbi:MULTISPECIES: phosphoglucosamine mutase [Fusobacterium]|jgi:phosphoglucosamine mutase|uniref:Phosphoglucosamine mutase n=1 Tax=Fusobacterium mortiferum TaxID=850 RepID=A0A414PX39_FUSMR|nr:MULTISPECIES: phosphoglucosamine mutase [Fusobacterium]MCF2626996.1 phosphoglucosamine mutase [Fusobacterium mortiferum]MCI7186615.1 phosphoglucosamine mutase [Fusobacterium mortiferum]MCI7664643.1 phosphoglucosamine mutase [Fusobacterium mortiferum]MDD7261590.1 phosphoglucosamine mutase [Fusobacterium mortiferum]MDY4801081.1 phosphoglucosamine mutase [Fusobacterium mortiferum]
MRKYFGTDGIRGEANRELTVDIALRLGYALGYYLKRENPDKKKIKVIMGCDTRISGYMLRSAMLAGLTSMGVHVDFVGVISTPAVAYLTKAKKADAGIMISASHNPAKDNGLKVFAGNGYKLPDEVELEIERLMDDPTILANPIAGDKVGKFKYAEDEYYSYRDHLLASVNGDFSGMKIVVDTANGSAYRIAKDVFLALGAEVVLINDAPNGTNINVRCGSTHPEILTKVVVGYEADLGLAYDGDADRLIAVDRHGNIIDGDKIIATLAMGMKRKGELKENKVVTTVMSNMGFENYLKENGIELLRANVGDRYVLEKMIEHNVAIGGEQSGHIILLQYATTGDGVLTSLKLVEALRDEKKYLDEMIGDIKDWPQKLVNVVVDNNKKNIWNKNKNITDFIAQKEKEMEGLGRVLVRTSGTEPLVRVMVEGKEMNMVEKVVNEIAEVVKKELA